MKMSLSRNVPQQHYGRERTRQASSRTRSVVVAFRKAGGSNLGTGSEFISPVLQSALKASLYDVLKGVRGAFDLNKQRRAATIINFLESPRDSMIESSLLAPDFTLTVHSPSWSSAPHTQLSKADFLDLLDDISASCPNFGWGAESQCDGLRDPDGTVLILARPHGTHAGMPFHVRLASDGSESAAEGSCDAIVQPSGCGFLAPLLELKFSVDDRAGLITHIATLSSKDPEHCIFRREGLAELLRLAPIRSTISYEGL